MANNPLPGLIPTHIANRLSDESRQRILWRARQRAEIILNRAKEGLHTRWSNSEPNTGMSFREYCATGQAAIELSDARMNAARDVLSQMVSEFLPVANSVTELWNEMQNEVAAAARDFGLTGPQRNLIWAEIQLQITEAADPNMEKQPITKTGASSVGEPRAAVNRSKTPDTALAPSATAGDEIQKVPPDACESIAPPAPIAENSAAPETAGSAVSPANREDTSSPDRPEQTERETGPKSAQAPAKRRGRLPIPGRRNAIRNALNKHGDNWRDHTGEVFQELDTNEVPPGDFYGMRIELDGTVTTVSKWADLDLAVGDQRKRIIDALRQTRR